TRSSESVSLTRWAAVEQPSQRQLLLPETGQPVRICRVPTPAPSGCFSRLTESFTSWVAVTPIMSSSLIRLSTIRRLTRGRRRQPLTLMLLPTTWLAVYLTTAERTISIAQAVPILPLKLLAVVFSLMIPLLSTSPPF